MAENCQFFALCVTFSDNTPGGVGAFRRFVFALVTGPIDPQRNLAFFSNVRVNKRDFTYGRKE